MIRPISDIAKPMRDSTSGAEFTLSHVSRGATVLARYLPRIGLEDFSPVATRDHPLHRL